MERGRGGRREEGGGRREEGVNVIAEAAAMVSYEAKTRAGTELEQQAIDTVPTADLAPTSDGGGRGRRAKVFSGSH
jgi:hypothetical protein